MYECDFEGQPLAEVFSVRLHSGEAPTGIVSVFDGKRGQIIYRRTPDQPHKPSSRLQNSGELPLTGPYRAVSADGCVAIVLDLQGHRQNKPSSSSSSSSYVAEILLDVYNENTRYDKAITHDDGFVQVRYALLSDAAETIVEVKLLRPRASGTVRRTIVAGTDLGEVVLFDDDDDGETTTGVGTQGLAVVLPLARSVVAVPLTSLLTIDVDLRLDGNETVRESVVSSVPKPGSEEVCCSDSGEVEVKITWLD